MHVLCETSTPTRPRECKEHTHTHVRCSFAQEKKPWASLAGCPQQRSGKWQRRPTSSTSLASRNDPFVKNDAIDVLIQRLQLAASKLHRKSLRAEEEIRKVEVWQKHPQSPSPPTTRSLLRSNNNNSNNSRLKQSQAKLTRFPKEPALMLGVLLQTLNPKPSQTP